jgi:peptide/nickel transport system substrate-binding protein
MMRRRDVLLSGAAAATIPSRFAIAAKQDNKLVRYVPTADLSVLDPSWTTTQVSITHGYYVFDTLFGIDHTQTPQPQMAEGATVSDDGRVWSIRLRDGLTFHDGEKVLARDAAASLRRWAARDVYGQTLGAVVEEFGAADDRTIRVKLKRPFPLILDTLAKPNGMLPVVMPERLANTDLSKPNTEMVGSGPYRFIKSEFVPGSSGAYEKFAGYVPRQEAPDWASGGKVAKIERYEWKIIPDASTAASALAKGEIDWWEQVQPDLLPMLRKNPDLVVSNFNTVGFFGTMRFNHLNPPFNNPAIRRAVRLGMNQEDYMSAVTGSDSSIYRECKALFPCGTPYGEELGKSGMTGDIVAAKRALDEAGYKGEKVVIINPADVPTIAPFGQVTYDYLRRLGMNVELQEMDWNTLAQRRTKAEPADKGGWSIFHNWWLGTSFINPAISPVLRGLGAKGWAGWFTDDKIEQLTEQWTTVLTGQERAQVVHAMHQHALDAVPTVVLGRFFILTAHRKGLTGILESTSPYPWNVSWS